MTVQELIALLEGVDGDTEVRLAMQPNYPFEYSISGATVRGTHAAEIEEVIEALHARDITTAERDEAQRCLTAAEKANQEIVYLLEGRQLGYISRDVWNN